ncbi:hypothetical protein FKG94_07050 [Exilibacterium tricleocarpae]|uniref:Winged helix-turn-helix domain-containing protein n=1 Tax=Exilibacterium tricleocarpae TaxID=2591008 RepID=A0A545TZ49_9GAMM|nr:hypothetical protein [Exilibacterium tricleocarpae]TQV82491.1 hypothetical protein FKG94_07050 [Exilibacterium tricleocarpae]
MDYLSLHPTASDTLEGIVRWWLRGDDINVVSAQRALNHLTKKKKVVAYTRAGGEVRYALKRVAPPDVL